MDFIVLFFYLLILLCQFRELLQLLNSNLDFSVFLILLCRVHCIGLSDNLFFGLCAYYSILVANYWFYS